MSRAAHKRTGVVLLGTACLLAALLCGAGTLTVRGVVVPPTVRLHVASIGIEAGVDSVDDCPPHCELSLPGSQERIYSVWFVSTTTDAGGERVRAQLLFSQALRR